MTTPTGFLNDAELLRLTGYSRKSKQVAWLRAKGVQFNQNACGHPVVCWAHVIGLDQPATPVASSWTPRPLRLAA